MKYSIVIPAYNEAQRIENTLKKLNKVFGTDAEIIVVDDGSVDNTKEKAESLGAKVVAHPKNKGKGAAVKTGFLAAKGDIIGFIDADESTTAEEAKRVFDSVKGKEVAIATRHFPGAKITVRQPPARSIARKVFTMLTQILFHLGIEDTQCGCKAMRRDQARKIAKRLSSNGFEFDVEMLELATRDGCRIQQVPITWKHSDKSKLFLLKHAPKMMLGLVRLKIKYGLNRRQPARSL